MGTQRVIALSQLPARIMANTSFFNDSQALVLDALQGLCRSSSELVLSTTTKSKAYNPTNYQKPMISDAGSSHLPLES